MTRPELSVWSSLMSTEVSLATSLYATRIVLTSQPTIPAACRRPSRLGAQTNRLAILTLDACHVQTSTASAASAAAAAHRTDLAGAGRAERPPHVGPDCPARWDWQCGTATRKARAALCPSRH